MSHGSLKIFNNIVRHRLVGRRDRLNRNASILLRRRQQTMCCYRRNRTHFNETGAHVPNLQEQTTSQALIAAEGAGADVSAWPRYPKLYEINTWVWLADLSQ